MHPHRRTLVAYALAAALIVVLAVAALSVMAAEAPAKPRCVEDAACWDWSTMGNRQRGVVTHYGRPMVVGPCRFARLVMRGRLDLSQPGDRMRGDRTAMLRYLNGGC